MPAMAVIFKRPVPARHILGVLLRMTTTSFRIPVVSWQISLSSLLVSSAHHGVACVVTDHVPIFFTVSSLAHGCRSHRPKLSMSWLSWLCPTFAITVPVLRHEHVQDLGHYATRQPGNLALYYYFKGSRYDIRRNLSQH